MKKYVLPLVLFVVGVLVGRFGFVDKTPVPTVTDTRYVDGTVYSVNGKLKLKQNRGAHGETIHNIHNTEMLEEVISYQRKANDDANCPFIQHHTYIVGLTVRTLPHSNEIAPGFSVEYEVKSVHIVRSGYCFNCKPYSYTESH